MNTVHVKASRAYNIITGSGLLAKAGELVSGVLSGGCTVAIVSDANVFGLYGETLRDSLEASGIKTVVFVFPAGEGAKSLDVYGALMDFLCDSRLTRTDAVITLGGGVAGDLGGFAASTYQRGIDLVHFPTTLLAAVDSSVGGKTALNLDGGKNQIGTFYQPKLVVCDTDCFGTLSEEEYRNGCAEIIKYAAIEKAAGTDGQMDSASEILQGGSQASLFELISSKPVKECYEDVIRICVEIKRSFVEKDEYDNGARTILNFGHTFGHAIEACSGFTVPHGQAVAAGMGIISRAAAEFGYCSNDTAEEIIGLIIKYGLPAGTDFPAGALAKAIESDKKNYGGFIKLVVPVERGLCLYDNVKTSEIPSWFKAGGVK